MNAPIPTMDRPAETTDRPRRGRHRRPTRLERVLVVLRGNGAK